MLSIIRSRNVDIVYEYKNTCMSLTILSMTFCQKAGLDATLSRALMIYTVQISAINEMLLIGRF